MSFYTCARRTGKGSVFPLLALLAIGMSTAYPEPTKRPSTTSTADHAKSELLQWTVKTDTDATEACLIHRTESSKQIRKITHWKWEIIHSDTDRLLEKKKLINSFCLV